MKLPLSTAVVLFLLEFAQQRAASALRGPQYGRLLKQDSDHFTMRGLADLDWEIELLPDGATINFDSDADNEVELKYNYTGDLGVVGTYTRLLSFQLLSSDCDLGKPVDSSILKLIESTGQDPSRVVSGENSSVELMIDIDRLVISNSPYWVEAASGLSADISFCVR